MSKRTARSAIATYSAMLLGATGVGIGIIMATPRPATAYLAMQNVELQRRAGDTYESFVARGKAVASTAAQRQFERDLLASEVLITVLGKNNGSQAAILRLRVKRSDWQRYPDLDEWTTVFTTAKRLLGFIEAHETENAPAPPPAPTAPTEEDFPDSNPAFSMP